MLDFLTSVNTKCVDATTCVSSPTVCGTSATISPIICATTCVCSPIICATICVCTPTICTTTSICSPTITGSTCIQSPIICATSCIVSPKMNLNNPTCTGRDLNVGGNGLYSNGNIQMALDKTFYIGLANDTGTRFKLFTTNCHAYFDYYDCLCFRSGPLNSQYTATLSSGGTLCVNQLVCSPIVCASTCFIGSGAGLTGTAASLTVGTATNATCLGGRDSSLYIFGCSGVGYINWNGCDVNAITKAGFYALFNSANAPTAGDGGLVSIPAWIGNDGTSRYNFQLASPLAGGYYARITNDSGVGTWHTIITSNNIGSQTVNNSTCLGGQTSGYYQPASTAINTSNIGSQSVNNSVCFNGTASCYFLYGTTCAGSQQACASVYCPYELSQYKSGFWETTGAVWTPTSDWYWGLTAAHTSNGPAYNYSLNLIGRGTGTGVGNAFYLRTVSGGAPAAWRRIYTDGDCDLGFNCNIAIAGYYATISGIPATGNIESVTQGSGHIMKDETSGTRWQIHSHGDRIRAFNGSTENIYTTTTDTIACATCAGTAIILYGNSPILYTAIPGTAYNCKVQMREAAGGGGNTAACYAPSLAFHWGSVVASSIAMETSGRISILNNPGTSYENLIMNCGFGVDFIASSDCRIKTCVKPITNALSTVLKLQGVNYQLCDDEKQEIHLGLIAQDVRPILPEIVTSNTPTEIDYKYGICDEKLGIKYEKITAVLIEAIKELDKKVGCLCKDLNYYKNLNYNKD